MHTHDYFMQQCLELAGKGLAQVAPNPMVGAVLVYQNQIIGKGYHQQYGQAHAEVHCLNSVLPEHRNYIPDSTLYVSLEPCSHFGKTPPCCHRILEEGIRKVVIATQDPNPEVHGRGVSLLREQGVEVIEGICSEQARFLNRRFFTFHEKQRPYLVLKWAESVEGYIGKKGERIQLSGEETHRTVHRWRSEEQAIWVGYETARNDNPQLNVRLAEGKHPLRLVFDRDLSLPSSLHLFQTAQPTLCFNQVMNRKEE
ncbi:MAG TPA: bifunctional diaminohydroxyphosphoribosylaminopyrimidine deaminase/5-amino-6-(5-phosphoribosylamino)uracil reductase RibD, partial [Chitinophagaceae bacterium]|nr:bifunctional diaminohydroxyphosphoribosylaminopyrimidine deaminase/5-amino-6-(5-phosphoribosylamino)uracil reductase RibD [Chitinophagaceae bacterium]